MLTEVARKLNISNPETLTFERSRQLLPDALNASQREAVCSKAPHLLVLAGAGTGKTRILIHRAAWLMANRPAADSGRRLMAVTFTNKAANELKERLFALPGMQAEASSIRAGTFHSMARRQLLQDGHVIGLERDFTIIDVDDQKRLVRQLMQQENINEKHYPAIEFVSWVNRHKEESRRACDADDHSVFLGLYRVYEQYCRDHGLVDFGELLLAACELMESDEKTRDSYRNRYRYLLVDEFQDTNAIQYRWLKNLIGKESVTTVVGDDDQTIYSWRGAKVENMQRYQKEFGAAVVKLEQNYRSTGNILAAANRIIANNEGRIGKTLFSGKEDGDKISVYSAYNESDEARFVTSIAEAWHADNRSLSEVAVLYRSNTQSRVLEEEMLRVRIPYRIYGGTRFYSRAEIKDALAWLHLINHPGDNLAFRRAITMPKRGVGEKTLARIQELDPNASLWDCCHTSSPKLPKSRAVADFCNTVSECRERCFGQPLQQQVELVLETSGLLEVYGRITGEGALTRADNLRELAVAAGAFEKQLNKGIEEPDEDRSVLELFLAEAALHAGEPQADTGDEYVHLMTLHASKGLEFPLVLIVGLEEDLFPHIKSVQNMGIEEERRLCYVGMTRAMEKLYMSFANNRQGQRMVGRRYPSRFLRELPEELVEEMGGSFSHAESFVREASPGEVPDGEAGCNGMHVGKKVRHQTFGQGVVVNIQGRTEDARITVNFANFGTKLLLLSHAKLTTLKSE